ncbi:hypothetical protein LEP1GSC050_1537 [Leptospira broomii serovar Hurstbridge str. 5399]|uniref:Uncharacterized protein n=4 Tax=Leptospira TaxID=171 RepID=V6HY26_9LEPT|nr:MULTISPECIES: hypothetical protein [Leptospira]EPG75244.1 hypothetical protein LEP1GSC058_2148 [Leptospira fainei serovar Hurstbridge str. BUT 6]EQA37909.1 hypothetical protein LEP1GSC047_4390 [Leptospira inadai serovar Lyme str. 10]EQA43275.1 hypothetical protein LEP1GSC050_1537 [Leptospira broomii serovar Hurstbridge str. 5399]PNV72070.1 hypothetical protein BES34_020180 [Leptospira inadai serovar Lyme]
MEQGNKFRDQLERYVNYRGIDIVLHLKDGSVVELDRNRRLVGEEIVYFPDKLNASKVPLTMISKADLFVA